MLKFPKCYWLWNYRVWLLQQANERLDFDVARELWARELILVGKMLVKDSRNFHGWGYRRTIVAQLESQKLRGRSMVESEFDYTTKVIHGDKGLSNFSAWHQRSKLIPRLLEERNADDAARRQFLEDGKAIYEHISAILLTILQNSNLLSQPCTQIHFHMRSLRGFITSF
jgi:geranylgeranyl transferase type-2 subunit alpha